MAPKGKNKAQTKATEAKKSAAEPRPAPKTIGEKQRADYEASRPYQALIEATDDLSTLTRDQQAAYGYAVLLADGAYQTYPLAQQEEFLAACRKYKIPEPLSKPKDLGRDLSGRRIGDYTIEEYKQYQDQRVKLWASHCLSRDFKERVSFIKRRPSRTDHWDESLRKLLEPITQEEIEEEKARRAFISMMETGKKVGLYAGNPSWDDVKPLPQDDGEAPLAAIAYTEEYMEAISYLRAIMAREDHSSRVLDLTAHVISLNPAHYTVWLYRATTLFELKASISDELEWVNSVALANQKNYQIWHHRQLLISKIYPTLQDQSALDKLAKSEQAFVTQMFEEDSKNYHVWSYRQYLVRTFSLFPTQTIDKPELSELGSVEALIQEDVRNNSAWSHRFFLVFSDPGVCTEDSKATEPDTAIPADVIEREVEFSKAAIFKAPINQSPWNYLRGVLNKGGRRLKELECFAKEFCKIEGTEDEVKSSHALDFLADVWTEEGEIEKADTALKLLGEKYDKIRKNYWQWRRDSLHEETGV